MSCEVVHVVLDSGAIISGSSIQNLGTHVKFWTTPNVLGEIKDKRSREALAAFPFQMHQQIPSASSMKFVCEFSKQCGEFHELSVTDLEVLALTHQLEMETNGTSNIRLSPVSIPASRASTSSSRTPRNTPNVPWESLVGEHPLDDTDLSTFLDPNSDIVSFISNSIAESLEHLEQVQSNVPAETSSSEAEVIEIKESKSEADNDGEGIWITEENVDFQLDGSWGSLKEDHEKLLARSNLSCVACITTDFGMQNVMAQMGLRLLAVDGRTMFRIRHWALGCFGCGQVTNDMSKEFCPSCGGHTLIRVGVSCDSKKGKISYHWNKEKTNTSRRGVKYSIPKPTGGRSGNKIILREDELLAERSKFGRSNRQKHSAEDWNEKSVEFGTVAWGLKESKRSAVKYGHSRRNPNEVVKGTGNRKKR